MTPNDRLSRIRDLCVAGLALVLLSPALGVIGAAVRLDSPGPALFRQERVGRDGVVFRIHKFRTMRVLHDGATVSGTGDLRVTRIGRVLRRTKLDELPQLIDVVRGDMSLVGPRPELAKYVDLWPERMRATILSVRPGVTDPASIRWRHESDELAAVADPERHYVENILPRKAKMYCDYVTRRSQWEDLRIMWRTLRAVARP